MLVKPHQWAFDRGLLCDEAACILRNAICITPFWEGTLQTRELISRQMSASPSGNWSVSNTSYGTMIHHSNVNESGANLNCDLNRLPRTAPFSVICAFKVGSTSAKQVLFGDGRHDSSPRSGWNILYYGATANRLGFSKMGANGGFNADISSTLITPSVGQVGVMGVTVNEDNTVNFFLNGDADLSNTDTKALIAAPSTRQPAMGGYPPPTEFDQLVGDVGGIIVWDVPLSVGQMRRYSQLDNFFSLFRMADDPPIWQVAAAPGGSSIPVISSDYRMRRSA